MSGYLLPSPYGSQFGQWLCSSPKNTSSSGPFPRVATMSRFFFSFLFSFFSSFFLSFIFFLLFSFLSFFSL